MRRKTVKLHRKACKNNAAVFGVSRPEQSKKKIYDQTVSNDVMSKLSDIRYVSHCAE